MFYLYNKKILKRKFNINKLKNSKKLVQNLFYVQINFWKECQILKILNLKIIELNKIYGIS